MNFLKSSISRMKIKNFNQTMQDEPNSPRSCKEKTDLLYHGQKQASPIKSSSSSSSGSYDLEDAMPDQDNNFKISSHSSKGSEQVDVSFIFLTLLSIVYVYY